MNNNAIKYVRLYLYIIFILYVRIYIRTRIIQIPLPFIFINMLHTILPRVTIRLNFHVHF